MSCSLVHSRVGARPAFAGCPLSVRRAPAVQAPRTLVIENAHKKGAGSTKNGRDSNSKSRGVKVYGGQPVVHGGIIVRQVGNTVRHFSLWGMNAHALHHSVAFTSGGQSRLSRCKCVSTAYRPVKTRRHQGLFCWLSEDVRSPGRTHTHVLGDSRPLSGVQRKPVPEIAVAAWSMHGNMCYLSVAGTPRKPCTWQCCSSGYPRAPSLR